MDPIEMRTRKNKPSSSPEDHSDFETLMDRVQIGDRDALPELCKEKNLAPGFWEKTDRIGLLAEDSLISVMVRKDSDVQEAIRRKLAKIKDELSGSNPTPLEKIIIDLLAVTWLQTAHANTLYAQRFGTDGLSEHKFRQQLIDHALRRFLSTSKTLAQVRRLLGPHARSTSRSSK